MVHPVPTLCLSKAPFNLNSFPQGELLSCSWQNMGEELNLCCCNHVVLCVHVVKLTFSAHAHRPMPKNAAPSNCKTKRRKEASLSDGKQQ